MSCYCEYSSIPSMFSDNWHKANKRHECCECGNTINIGDQYQRISGVWDDLFSSYKTCERCADLRYSMEEAGCMIYGGIKEEYWKYLDAFMSLEDCNKFYNRVFPVADNNLFVDEKK